MSTPEDTRRNAPRRPFTKSLLINLGIMALATLIIIWLALVWLDVWTDHGHCDTVPEVKGLNYETAVSNLAALGFTPEISDSIYESGGRPGSVLEQNPKAGTKVKEGRVVYLTIAALQPKTVSVPMLVDVSERQARSVLEGLGFKDIEVRLVPSEFKGLVLGVTRNNVPVTPGARVPVTSRLVLEVGEGYLENDSLQADSLGGIADIITE